MISTVLICKDSADSGVNSIKGQNLEQVPESHRYHEEQSPGKQNRHLEPVRYTAWVILFGRNVFKMGRQKSGKAPTLLTSWNFNITFCSVIS